MPMSHCPVGLRCSAIDEHFSHPANVGLAMPLLLKQVRTMGADGFVCVQDMVPRTSITIRLPRKIHQKNSD